MPNNEIRVRQKESRHKKGLVQIEVTSEGKRKWIGTSVKVYADQWNGKRKLVNSVNSIQLNAILDGMMAKLNEFILELVRNNRQFDFEKLNALLEKSTRSDSFIEFVRKRIEDRTDLEESTRKQHRTLLQSLEKFGKINYMDDLTKSNITLYDDFLHQQEISQPTIYNYHKRLKRYLHEAMKFGMLYEDSYVGLHLERGKFEKRKYLTEEEMKTIHSCKINVPAIDRVRDLFLFQCYTRLAYTDFEKFDFEKDVEERNGKYIVADRRKKTNEDYKIVLLTPAIEVVAKMLHIGLCDSTDSSDKRGIGVFLANIGVGYLGDEIKKFESVTSIDFSIPIKLPYSKTGEGNVYER